MQLGRPLYNDTNTTNNGGAKKHMALLTPLLNQYKARWGEQRKSLSYFDSLGMIWVQPTQALAFSKHLS